jgi:phosphoglycolate phosphatase
MSTAWFRDVDIPARRMYRTGAMTARHTVAFDLDGTLVDTAPDLIGTLNVVLGEARLDPIQIGDARAVIGRGARVMIERGFALRGVRLAEHELDRLRTRFLAHYDEHLAEQSRPFPGAQAALDALAAAGARLVICTNKPERYSVKLLAALGLHDRFAVIAGADTFPVCKPDPGHLLGAVERAGGVDAAVIMVGDSAVDVATARAAKVPIVAVSYGYSDVPAAQLGADRVVDQLEDVPAAVAALLRASAFADK